jgi:hypothetical protein
MSDCHHKECCSCERLATVVAEVVSRDGDVTRFDLCEPHYVMVVQEAQRKRMIVVVSEC